MSSSNNPISRLLVALVVVQPEFVHTIIRLWMCPNTAASKPPGETYARGSDDLRSSGGVTRWK